MVTLPSGITLRKKPKFLEPGETPEQRLASLGLTLGTGDITPVAGTGDTGEAVKKPVEGAEEPFRPSVPRVLRDKTTGKVTGIEIGGRTFLGINAEQAQQIIESQKRSFATPEGAVEFERPEVGELRAQQQFQQQQTQELISLSPVLSEMERLQLSGAIVPTTLANFMKIFESRITGKPLTRLMTTEEFLQSKTGQGISIVLGTAIKFINNIPVAGPGINKALFGDYERTIANLQDDAGALAGTSRLILMGVRDGGDPDEALAWMNKIESAIRQRYADAVAINQENPDSIREGLDLTDDLINILTTVQQRRFIIERYKLTRNPSELISATNIPVEQEIERGL